MNRGIKRPYLFVSIPFNLANFICCTLGAYLVKQGLIIL